MAGHLILNDDYKNWIASLSSRYRSAQIKAAVAVNAEMLQFYWELGRDIVAMQSENKYGSRFFETLSRDLKAAIPDAKGLSSRNLQAIRKFYLMYSKILPQVEAKSLPSNLPQPVANSEKSTWPPVTSDLFSIPWGHHRLLMDKYFNDPEIAVFYIRETLKHGWSRSVLDHMLDTKLHLRHGSAISNFSAQLPPPASDLAQEITKDPYIFDFTNLTEPYQERELKEALLRISQTFYLNLEKDSL